MDGMINAIDLNELDYCTGCKMCADVCPGKAITFQDNHEGFWYPRIDYSKCVNCGLCKQKCPAINKHREENLFTPKAYSAANKNSDVRGLSTSGGLFGELARQIIADGGVVFGCAYTDDYKRAYHTMAESIDELYSLIGTKYFQSDTEQIYSSVKNYLEKGRCVLFSGTPCQNAALKSFLGKEYKTLYQMDFICNSISSPLAYRKWLEDLEDKYNSKVSKVRFKDKKEGWTKLNTEVQFENGEIHREDRENSLWGAGLIKYNLYQRKSCYQCNFRGTPNVTADITVGDFWGIEDLDSYDMAKGVSVVVLNTVKGQELFEKVSGNLIYRKRTLQEVIDGNPRLMNDPEHHIEREKFFELLSKKSFSKCVTECTGEKFVKENAKNLRIQEIINVCKDGRISVKDYIYLNYLSSNIIRKGKAKIIPYKNSVFDLSKDAHIVLYGDQDFHVGKNKLKKSKAETLLRMESGATIELYHGGELIYGTTMEIKKHAKFSAGWFGLNTGSNLICQRHIRFGESVMCGRNCAFIDSDFHQLQTLKGAVVNPPKEIEIKDHVWITDNVRVLPGSIVGSNSIIGPYTVINTIIPDWSYVVSNGKQTIYEYKGRWSQRGNNIPYKNVNSKGVYRQILVGFGKEGKEYYKNQSKFIEAIIDNHSTDERTMKFEEFCRRYPQLDEDVIFVIGSSKYYKVLYKMVKKKYPSIRIVEKDDIFD